MTASKNSNPLLKTVPSPSKRRKRGTSGARAGATSLMSQWQAVKDQVPDAIIFFRLGDFYEMFHDDAVYVAEALGLTLTTRDKGKENAVPMCGVPHHAARTYLAKLTENGHRVALVEQLEDPKSVKGIVKRGVVRIVTPGVILDEESLDPRTPNYVASVCHRHKEGYGLAFIDVSTGDFRATEVASAEALVDELGRAEPRELVLDRGDTTVAALAKKAKPDLHQAVIADPASRDDDVLRRVLGAAYDEAALGRRPLAKAAAERVLRYACETQLSAPLPISSLELFERQAHLVIDEQARRHLELTQTMASASRLGSLLNLVDVTRSAMGGRLLRRWLLFPLVQVAPIRRRHDAVASLVSQQSLRDAIRDILKSVADIERLTGRARLGVASPRDLASLGLSLRRLPELSECLRTLGAELPGASEPAELLTLGDDLAEDLAEAIALTLTDDAGTATKDGGFVRAGYSAELDELREIAAGGRDHILAIEARERARTGISTLKIKFNNVFGYFIEITRSQLSRVPDDYVRKQTVANAERFVTPELADHESKIASADERRIDLEKAIFNRLLEQVAQAAQRLQGLSRRVAQVDVLAAFAEVGHRRGYVRPVVDESDILELEDSRHPVVESLLDAGAFVPNDIRLDTDTEQLLLVTGPNMAGKSTLIRQVALSVVMAQMGAFVPAKRAHIGICDRVFTRVGAGDDLARGESTFLVEMRETAHILRHATGRSLIVLDEIGRGTSTYDGVSIAWAIAEHLHDAVKARALFATHYHELCALVQTHVRAKNVSVSAREISGEVVFLRKLVEGAANRSFGVEVGRLAGLPPNVVERAREILAGLEGENASAGPVAVQPERGRSPQLGLFEPAPAKPAPSAPATAPELEAPLDVLNALARAIEGADVDDLSPRAAWALLETLQKKLTKKRSQPS